MRCSSEATRDTRAQLREIVWVFFIDPMALFSKNKQRQHCPMPNKWSAPAFPKNVIGVSGMTQLTARVAQRASFMCHNPRRTSVRNVFGAPRLPTRRIIIVGSGLVWVWKSRGDLSVVRPSCGSWLRVKMPHRHRRKKSPWPVPLGVHVVPSRRRDCIACARVVGERATRVMLPGTCEAGRSTL